MLEEWLQQLYVENYDEFSEYATELYGFTRLESEYSVYFYIPSRDADGVSLSYVVDSNDNALYLINKSKLPDEIKSQIAGGDAGDGSYSSYASLTDVYGVTSDLKVYYCSAGLSTILGATEDDLDVDNPARPVTLSSELATLLGTSTNTTAENLRTIKTLTIDSTITSLSELYNLTSLQELTIEGANLSNLSGIENCSKLYYVYFKSSTVGDYSAMAKLGSKLTHLYFYDINDDELATACTGLASAEFSSLEYLAVVGNVNHICTTFTTVDTSGTTYSAKSEKKITTLEPLDSLSSTTKSAVHYLSIQNNEITGDLSAISDYTNLILLRCEYNSLTNLNGLSNMSSLKYLCGAENQLGATAGTDSEGNSATVAEDTEDGTAISSLAGKTSLYAVNLVNNSYLANVEYFVNYNSSSEVIYSIQYLYLAGCSSSMSVTAIGEAGILDKDNGIVDYSLPVAYLDGTIFKLSDYFTASTFTDDLLKQYLKGRTSITHLNLEGATQLTNATLNEVLETMINLKYVTLNGCTGLTTIDFVHELTTTDGVKTGVTGLIELDLRNTGDALTNLTNLNSYATSLKTLRIDNPNMDLTTIQSVISNLGNSAYWYTAGLTGLCCTNLSLFMQLEDCTNLTKITVQQYNYTVTSRDTVLDLTSLNDLTTVSLGGVHGIVELPTSVTSAKLTEGGLCVFSKNTGTISSLWYNNSVVNDSMLKNSFSSLSNVQEVTLLTLSDMVPSNGFTDFSAFKYCSTSNVNEVVIQRNGTGTNYFNGTSLSGIENISSGLSKLTINNCQYITGWEALSGLEELTYASITNTNFSDLSVFAKTAGLTTLILNDNSIDALKPLEGLTSLTTLNLQNNLIDDKSTYENDSGETVIYRNLEILANLYNNGALRTLYISGNSDIDDYSLITACEYLVTDL